MDFPVEATLDLHSVHDEAEVRKVLRSYGFEMKELSRNELRVQGSFLKLKAVKAQLEQLLNAQTQRGVHSSSHHPVSSGAIPKTYSSSSSSSRWVSDGRTSRNNSPLGSPSSPGMFQSSNSPQYRTSSSPRRDQHDPVRTGSESLVVEGDVYQYAMRLSHRDINNTLANHGVQMETKAVGESYGVTLRGRDARNAADKLQRLLNSLTTSLRTQDVPCKDMNDDGRELLQRVKETNSLYNSVLVRDMGDRLHLIGPSLESYELKQKLLGRWVDPPRRAGRTLSGNSTRRSRSVPPAGRRNADTQDGVTTAGHSVSKRQDDGLKRSEPERGASRGRTLSESRHDKPAERPNGLVQEKGRQRQPSQKSFKQLLHFDVDQISNKFKRLSKKKKEP